MTSLFRVWLAITAAAWLLTFALYGAAYAFGLFN